MARLPLLVFALAAACSDGGGGTRDATPQDASDSGLAKDAQPDVDAGTDDGGGADALPDSGSLDAGMVLATIDFPPQRSLTSAARVTVTGHSDPTANVDGIVVDGAPATSDDGFVTWRAQVDLQSGDNAISVDAQSNGATFPDVAAAMIRRQDVLLLAPRDFVLDGDTLYAVDSALARVVAIDLGDLSRTVVSSAERGAGPAFDDPRGIAFDGARLIVTNRGTRELFAVDPATGDRTVLSGDTVGLGPLMTDPDGLALSPQNDIAYVLDATDDQILSVQLATGDRSVFSGGAVGLGPPLSDPRDAAVFGTRLVVADSGASALFAIELATGNRTVIDGGGPFFGAPRGVTIDAAANAAYVSDDELDAVLRVDLFSGDRSIVADVGNGTGELVDPRHLLLRSDRLLVLDYILDAVLDLDPTTGDRTPLIQDTVGAGPHFGGPWAVTIDAEGRAYVADLFFELLASVDLQDGARTIVSDDSNTGPNLDQPYGLALDPANDRALLADAVLDGVIEISLADGSRTNLSNDALGTGPMFDAPRAIALGPSGNAFVVDSGLDALISVDLVTGDRTVVSDALTGTGPAFDAPWGLVLDRLSEHAYVTDSGPDTLFVVDLLTGDRTTLDDTEPVLAEPRNLAYDAMHDRVVLADLGLESIFAIDLATGMRTEISSDAVGEGPSLTDPAGIAIAPSGVLVVVDNNDSILAIEPVSGDRVYLSK